MKRMDTAAGDTAYRLGYVARQENRFSGSNPFPSGTTAYSNWNEGYVARRLDERAAGPLFTRGESDPRFSSLGNPEE